MHPPEWALKGSYRLDLDEFQACFAEAWSRVESSFLKLECWQSYREREGNQSQEEYQRGDIERACDSLRAEAEAEADRPAYEDVRKRGIDFARIRLVQEPLTDYLRYELLSYQIRAGMGENIEIVRYDPTSELPNENHFDLLLFDRHTALIHDYGTGRVGRQTGGWINREPDILGVLEERVTELRHGAIPLNEFLDNSRDLADLANLTCINAAKSARSWGNSLPESPAG